MHVLYHLHMFYSHKHDEHHETSPRPPAPRPTRFAPWAYRLATQRVNVWAQGGGVLQAHNDQFEDFATSYSRKSMNISIVSLVP